jgi:hypothetical protein
VQIATKLAQECADSIIENVRGYELVEGSAREALVGELRDFLHSAPAIAAWESMANPAPPQVAAAPDGRIVLRDSTGRDHDPMQLLVGIAGDLQKMLALQLRGLTATVTEVSLTLRRATADVLDGAPCLFRKAAADERPGGMNLQHDDLALPVIPVLQHRLRRVHKLLAADTADQSVSPATATAPAPSPPDAAPNTPGEPEEKEARREVVPPGVVDLRSVVEHLSAMSDELEKAWSEALSRVEGGDAYRNLLGDWASLMKSLGHWIDSRSAELRTRGVDIEIPATLLALDPDAVETELKDDQERWTQLQVAQLQAVRQLGEAFRALAQPSHLEITIDEDNKEELRRWWEAGAFEAAARAARFVLRLQDEVEAVEARLLGGAAPDTPAMKRVFERAALAKAALLAGDPESAILHLNSAYRVLLDDKSGTYEEVIERLAADPDSARLATAAKKLSTVAARIASEEFVDLGAVTVTAMMGAAELSRRFASQPEPVEPRDE